MRGFLNWQGKEKEKEKLQLVFFLPLPAAVQRGVRAPSPAQGDMVLGGDKSGDKVESAPSPALIMA